jgi:glutaredoxin
MKFLFRAIRRVLGNLILFIDWLTRPRRAVHAPDKQQQLDAATARLALYQFQLCPFCVKTRRTIHRLGLNIETRDARNDPAWNQELIEQGGRYQVPCLRIAKDDGSVAWLYESRDINSYLEQRFG